MDNLKELGLNSLAKYNGKPALITKSGSVFQGDDYVEANARACAQARASPRPREPTRAYAHAHAHAHARARARARARTCAHAALTHARAERALTPFTPTRPAARTVPPTSPKVAAQVVRHGLVLLRLKYDCAAFHPALSSPAHAQHCKSGISMAQLAVTKA
eukprot:3003973-Pleurochrysis_carterae.AAC.1